MNLKYYPLLLVLFTTFFSCSKSEVTSLDSCNENLKEDCFCITLYEPVCGCNQVTYGNSCEASCAGITEVTKGECKYDIKPLIGPWEFIGYESEGAKSGNENKSHSYVNMELTFSDEKDENGYYKYSGKSSINLMQGYFYLSKLNTYFAEINLTTRIAGTLEAIKYEDKYLELLSGSLKYNIEGKYLRIESKSYANGVSLINDEVLIFKKK